MKTTDLGLNWCPPTAFSVDLEDKEHLPQLGSGKTGIWIGLIIFRVKYIL